MSLSNNPGSLAIPLTENQEEEVADATVSVLADVLRVFAARGRAIRETRVKNGMVSSNPRELGEGEIYDY